MRSAACGIKRVLRDNVVDTSEPSPERTDTETANAESIDAANATSKPNPAAQTLEQFPRRRLSVWFFFFIITIFFGSWW